MPLSTLSLRVRSTRRRRNRTATVIASVACFTGVLVLGPVTGGVAEEAKPVTPAVQDISLGTPSDPAAAVDVVPADQSPAPSADAESVAPTASTTATPPSAPATPPSATTTQTPQSSDPAATGDPTAGNPAPAPSDELSPEQAMSVPEGAQTLVLDKTQTNGFSSVGISWLGDAPVNGIALQLRVKDVESGQWSDWTELVVNRDVVADPDMPDIRQGSDPYWFGTSAGVEVAVTVIPGTEISDLKLTLIDPKKLAQDSNAQTAAPTSSAGAAVPKPEVYSRAQWGANEAKMSWTPEYMPTIKASTLHHSADSNNYTSSDVPGLMRSIYQYQAVTLGWGDIGYNVVVDKFGRAWEGRAGGLDKPVVGAHAGGFNRYTFGVSMLGNYDLVSVPEVVKTKVAQLIAWKFSLHGVNPTGSTQLTQYGGSGTTAKWTSGTTVTVPTVFGHRDVGKTVCPGKYGYAILPGLRTQVQGLMSATAPPATTTPKPQPTKPPSTQPVAAPSTPAYDPLGSFAVSDTGSSQISVNGWAYDPSAPAQPVSALITVDGAVSMILVADGPRPELAGYGIPGSHGIDVKIGAGFGSHDVCMFAFNIGAGNNSLVGCTSVVLSSHDPVGAIAAYGGDGVVSFDGWAYDPSSPYSSLDVKIRGGGNDLFTTNASGLRSELPLFGITANHGFAGSVQTGWEGPMDVCVYGVNIGAGASKNLDCQTVTIRQDSPRGAMWLSRAGGIVNANGWSFDPNDPGAPVTVMITVNGSLVTLVNAAAPRPELALYGVPGNHGFTAAFTAPSNASVCMFVFNLGAGSNTLVQCTVA